MTHERRGRLTANDRWGLMDQFIVRESLDHEQSKVYAASDVALEHGIANVPAPNGQTLTFALF
jgi:hypothetical protein